MLAGWLHTDWLPDWLTDWLTDWLPDWLTDWLNESMTDKCSPDWDTEARLVSWLAGVLFDRLTDLLTNFSTIFGSVIVLFFDLFQIQREKTERIRKAEENFHFGSEINVQWNLIYCNLCCEKISSADIIILTISIFSARIRASISFSCLSSFVSDVQNIISEVKSPKFAWSENVNLDEKLRNSTHLPYVALKLRCGAARGNEHIQPLAKF